MYLCILKPTYQNWNHKEPNNWKSEEDCVEAIYKGWNDISCDANKSFICMYVPLIGHKWFHKFSSETL